jgi:hypothetical protein
MKTLSFLTVAAVLAMTAPAFAQDPSILRNVPTGDQVKGCTFYKLKHANRTMCIPTWKIGLKQSQSNASSTGE